MKRTKRLYLLLGVLVVLSVAAFAVKHVQQEQARISISGEVVLDIDSADVTALAWTYDNESLAFHKDGDVWTYDDDAAFPVDAEKIQALLSYFSEMGAAFIIEDADDLGQYGLDDPACTITITTDDGETTINLGAYSTMDQQRYLSTGDGNVYLVTSDPLSAYEIVLADMIDNDDLPAFDQVDRISISGPEDYEVVYQADSTDTICADDVYFKQDGAETAPLDTEKVEQYLAAISGLSQDTYVTYNATDDDLAAYGLDAPELTLHVDDTDDENESATFTLTMSRAPETKAAAAEDDAEDTAGEGVTDSDKVKAYVRIGDSSIIYEISETSYDALMACTYNDLRHSDVFTGDVGAITRFDIGLDDAQYSFTADEDDGFSYNGEAIDLESLTSALTALTIDSFTDETADGLAEELRLTLGLDGAIPEQNYTFYRYDGDHCLLAVDGDSVGLVPRSQVVDLIEAINAVVL